ncbi:hypothetical protein CONLIGDRAFT_43125 [Coniochaeta ligniaria NRRL 30616]|uniref:Uncharacterized protein n=1 Tax=Coniochaeta ligniaria NRRL 30616 TaxID=1408157 RepID=A0A1J7J4U2_9PEZI|nr:hypothetical protein CONLIGDRAFT_43125 [Coniochaeta ligniaria NRRL 30616]
MPYRLSVKEAVQVLRLRNVEYEADFCRSQHFVEVDDEPMTESRSSTSSAPPCNPTLKAFRTHTDK